MLHFPLIEGQKCKKHSFFILVNILNMSLFPADFPFRQSIDHCYVSRPSGPKQLLRGNLVSGGMESAQEVQLLPEGANL